MDASEYAKDWVGIYLKDAQYKSQYPVTTLEVLGSTTRIEIKVDQKA
jgi:hypothetical protein